MKHRFLLLTAMIASLLSACSPHPSAGKWKAIGDNEPGINELSILFDGKAEFTTTTNDVANWHCFWRGKDDNISTMACVPSSDTERRVNYEFAVQGEQQGELLYQGKAIATFKRQPYE